MSRDLSFHGVLQLILALAVLPTVGKDALAAVLAVDASVATVVQELIDGRPASVNADDDTRGPDGAYVPLSAFAELISTDLQGALIAQGRGLAVFHDPTRLDQPNPEELALEVACYSNAESVSYLVAASTVETRTIRFNLSEIAFGIDGTRTVESRVFLSGAVVFWAQGPGADFQSVIAEINLVVSRGGVEAPLFDSGLTLGVGNDGIITTETTGPIQSGLISIDELAHRGVDEQTISVLRDVADEGSLVIVAIPLQGHAYRYVARASESFEISARLETRIRNAPGGTGVAVALGRPFSELAAFIEQGLPGVKGAAIERAINETVDSLRPADSQSESPVANRRGAALCGALGGGVLGTMLLPVSWLSLRRRRGHPR